MTFDSRWKEPQGGGLHAQLRWAQDTTRELRKGAFFDTQLSGITAAQLSQVLDALGSAEPGVMLFRGNPLWMLLAPGEFGQRLISKEDDGPSWSDGLIEIAEGTLAGATVELTDISEAYSMLALKVTGMSFDNAAQAPLLQVSTDGGSSWDTTAGNYSHQFLSGAATGALSAASLITPVNHANAADTSDHIWIILGWQTGYALCVGLTRIGAGHVVGLVAHFGTNGLDALRFAVSGGGQYDGGVYILFALV